MAELRFNDAQLRAINEDGKNILVSAAAGSGKTTVLTARILREVVKEGADIDSFIIMTFTKAAAAHMREKIYEEIKKVIKTGAYNGEEIPPKTREHLKHQLMKVHGARICTIDALCMEIVRENFQCIELDPGFRIADEAELNMLKTDVMKEIIEEHYAEPTENFLEFAGCYTDKNDSKLDELILTLYDFSQSHPEPSRWLENSIAPYVNGEKLSGPEDAEAFNWPDELAKIVSAEEQYLLDAALWGRELCDGEFKLEGYVQNFDYVIAYLKAMNGNSFDNQSKLASELLENWKSLPRVSSKDVDVGIKEASKILYNDIKSRLSDLHKRFLFQGLEEMYLDMASCGKVATELKELTEEFADRFLAEKTEKKIAGFNDISHFALKVLIEHDENGLIVRDGGGRPVYTEIADNMAKQIREIIVDEYQDTNRLQDELVEALSSERFGRPNRFMVGDVKQSIYGFRMACPELFVNKSDEYKKENGNGELIVLGENYRSRKEIIDLTNAVFTKAMVWSVGKINYTLGHALCQGRPDEEKDEELVIPEIHMLKGSGEAAKNAESYLIAKKIEELTEKGYAYSDIAILTRTSNNPILERMLTERKIPVRKASNRGFFESVEVMLALDLLRIVDNPYQDIPMAAVLLSPLTETTADTLAEMKAGFKGTDFSLFEAAKKYGETDEKTARFIRKIEEYREKSTYFGISNLIDYVMEDSGLYNVLSAMPQGEGRKANIDFLKNLAVGFAKGSYTGLFNFIRYVEAMQKSDMDFGEAQNIAGDAVQMMTIHKSKGLEFPVVILAAAGKSYNETDLRQPIVLDREGGLGIEKRDIEKKIKTRTLLQNIILEKKKIDMFAEEMRLLYVAMTRAMEKLIVTGTNHQLKGKYTDWYRNQEDLSEGLQFPASFGAIKVLNNHSYMALLGAVLSEIPLDMTVTETDKEGEMTWKAFSKKPLFFWSVDSIENVEIERAFELFNEEEQREKIENLIQKEGDGIAPYGLDYEYPFEKATITLVKLTASQLEEKKDEDEPEKDIDNSERIEKKQSLKEGTLSPSERGTAYHKVFELLDFQRKENITEELVEKGYLDRSQADAVMPEHITRFLETDLFQRMAEADRKGKLKREQQFVMGFEENGELRLLQGIIDAFFEEDGEIVLVDYKTNRGMTEEELKDHYRIQQERYASAIQNATGKKVKEMILYSTESGKEIRL